MPSFRGREIWEWGDEVARLKREGLLDEALEIATGCMAAMVRAAEKDSANVMEHYVIQVAIIQHKKKAFADETAVIQGWLDRGLPTQREDHRLDLKKRLAKAQELWAKAEGRDSTTFNSEWRDLVELGKKQKATQSPPANVASGRSTANLGGSPASRKKRSRLVPTVPELLLEEYVAVDFETANRASRASACQIALVKVDNGVIVDRYATLLKPPPGLDYFEFTYLHGIGASDVKRAPMWGEVAPGVTRFVADLPVYAHNAAFDASVWKDLDAHFGTRTLPESFFCSFRTARNLMPGLPNYKLPTVVEACAPGYQLDHHQAASDAEACALIVSSLQRISAAYS